MCRVRTCALQGGLSRNKVAVGESAAGSPPKQKTHQPDADKPIKILKPEIRLGFPIFIPIFVHPESNFSGEGLIACAEHAGS